MAEERDESEHTEDPTPKRLEEAIRRGDVVKSAEVNTWFMVAGGTLTLMVFAAPAAVNLETTFRGLLEHAAQIPTDGLGLAGLMAVLARQVLAALGIPAEWHISPGVAHGIDQEGLRQGGEFLARFLAR